ncbi:LLM class flavin-dependent oxidoreductase [Thermostaphylospora chromogena]|uniref:Flavin-dependent oxidoreductase, luciferase family (Includes alkanesulfonate monooxygenase SsuD and methylene tetrahydromethanopterin reductase) n=1 Tax=Thermostaphylospora chromogena TaxID=35622 RepID=A0A1H1EEG0_9ACTN|nr:LLM class flavin-dependent oxidoreductase [Thermostaphylospora chromogena]SDQ87142.1 Flavin-dependent oxidoreductase, luciferase family (includes alkanesulfonate monooxygenase SsuD and methylene tetrahydromethanopterin reductase) [Thermostaphylospora chromogena]
MTDYGHDLLFGTFLTPTAETAGRVVELARLTERSGLDMVSVQDHPYQPAFLDAWTLLTGIATATERVKVFPNVANLPLRPPAVLARAAASLDVLSGGRVELGLGAGVFWDAIGAEGGPRRTPAEAVTALEEAIAIIRGLWRPGDPLHLDGKHYQVQGAKPGPIPPHDISVWLGALKPRMLRLTGRLADGWLPSSPYVPPERLAEGNRIIDEAAEAAGRSPGDVRRLYNIFGRFGRSAGFLQGPPTAWAEQLAELTLEHGVSAFILASDDPDDIRRFAAEVVPAVRELVAAERAGTGGDATTTGRTAAGKDAQAPDRNGAPKTAPRAHDLTGETAEGLGVTPTPDDGVRLSAERVWDESTRPTGPKPEPGRRYTARERANGQHLIDVHDHLRAELAQLRDLMEQVLAGTMDPGTARSHIHTMTMRQNNWTLGTYCASYCRAVTVHHTLEDRGVFPHLRAADPRLAPVLDRLEEEHHAIHGVIERVDRALVAFVNSPDGATELRAAVDLLTDTLLSHLSYEERELVEPLARLGFQ